jgi:hypothetical protein
MFISKLVMIKFFAFLLLIALPFAATAQVTVRAYVDQTSVAVGSPFYYTIEVSGNTNFNEVKLGATQAFDQQPSVSTSQSVTIVNGQMAQTKAFTYALVPKKEGKQTIPAATVSIGGQTYTSNTIEVTVSKAQAAQKPGDKGIPGKDQVFIRAVVDKTKLVVGEAATITYKLYYKANITRFESPTDLKPEGFWVERFDAQKIPSGTEFYNGSMYRVSALMKVQVFPTRAGKLEIPPFNGTCEALVTEMRRSGNLFDDFSLLMGAPGKYVKVDVTSQTLKFDVSDLPQPKPASFNGAVGDYSFNAVMTKKKIREGDVATIQMDINGEGNIATLTPPPVTLPTYFDQYEPKIESNINRTSIINGTKKVLIDIVPKAAGKFDIGPIEFSYFNPKQKKYITLASPKFDLEVETNPNAVAASNSGDKRDIAKFGADFRYIKYSRSLAKKSTPFYAAWWFYLLLIIPFGALGFFYWQEKRDERMRTDTAYARSTKASPEAKKRSLKMMRKDFLLNSKVPSSSLSAISSTPKNLRSPKRNGKIF